MSELKGNRRRKQILKSLNASESPEYSFNQESEVKEIEKTEINEKALSKRRLLLFQTPKKYESSSNKTSKVNKEIIEKTPYKLREKIKKNIIWEQLSSSDNDYSDSGSEYMALEEENESSSTSSNSQTDNETEIETPVKPIKFNRLNCSKNVQYFMKTDEFFSNNSSTKNIITSNNTLDKLETPRLPQDQLQKLLTSMKLSNQHEKCLNELNNSNKPFFRKWLYLLHENFNILLYGLGSKSNLLNQFCNEYLKELPVIVINGFFPTLTIRDILDSIIVDLLELKENPSSIYDACSLIEKELNYVNDIHYYIIIHNIDMIRNNKAHNIFSKLTAIKNVHFIVSVDHINTSLLWDHSKLSKFNFTWWDCTTFQSYVNETSYENSMIIQKSGTLALSSLKNVFLSLTLNSKKIYEMIVQHQLENAKNQYFQGIAFKDLYWACREAFLVSSDLVLRAQLTEFVDHKMIKLKRSGDGTEYLTVPISNTLLQQFIYENTC